MKYLTFGFGSFEAAQSNTIKLKGLCFKVGGIPLLHEFTRFALWKKIFTDSFSLHRLSYVKAAAIIDSLAVLSCSTLEAVQNVSSIIVIKYCTDSSPLSHTSKINMRTHNIHKSVLNSSSLTHSSLNEGFSSFRWGTSSTVTTVLNDNSAVTQIIHPIRVTWEMYIQYIHQFILYMWVHHLSGEVGENIVYAYRGF